jgi:hypothetical protein
MYTSYSFNIFYSESLFLFFTVSWRTLRDLIINKHSDAENIVFFTYGYLQKIRNKKHILSLLIHYIVYVLAITVW